MRTRPIVKAFVVLAAIVCGPIPALADDPLSPAGGAAEVTPARVSYIHGEVSFWRPGAQDWAEARVNTPLAPGDVLYTGQGGTVEIQFGPRAFVRAGNSTQIGLDNHEHDYVQFRVTAGHAALDLRELAAGHTVELATPNAAFTVERAGYYHVDLRDDSVSLRTHRGGTATAIPVNGTATAVAANQQITISGTDAPQIETGRAPALTAWDNWNYQRTAYLLQPSTTQRVPAGVYGAETLAQHGSWRTVETYGSVWVPAAVAPGWVPYSTGRWIWDPRFGWSWLDDAPWGWAPYHYGRWVFVGSYWAWAPGPLVVRPVYSPALVVFLGGPVTVTVGVRPLHWAPLGWGEPLIPWWGRPGFIGVVSWHGWGGPRVVNNVVVQRTTVVNVTNVTVYRNVHVHNAVVGVPAERFGHGRVQPVRVDGARVRELMPVRGALDVKPVPTSVMPGEGSATKPPAPVRERKVVATRAPRDVSPALQAQGLGASREVAPSAPPHIVPAPKRQASKPGASPGALRRDETPGARRSTPSAPGGPDVAPRAPRPGAQDRAREPEDKVRGAEDKARGPAVKPPVPDDKKARAATPPESTPSRRPIPPPQPPPAHQPATPRPAPSQQPTTSRQAPPRAPATPEGALQQGRPGVKPDPRTKAPAQPHGRGEREQGAPSPERAEPRPGR
jgi:hypothetical protein